VGLQFRLELQRATSYRREDFIVSPTNIGAVRAIDSWPSWHTGALALVGPEAVGKSHLARAWATRTGAAVLAASEGAATDLAELQGRPVLLEDADQGAPDEVLFHLINMAGVPGGGLLLTGRTLPSAWPTDLPDLRSRLNAMHVAELPPPDDAILEGLLKKFFRERNIKPTDDLIPYLLRRMERSATRAQELVAKLDEVADAEQRAVSRALARQVLDSEQDTLNLFD
jgi:chromosomal replication initiation ATPase DnaA